MSAQIHDVFTQRLKDLQQASQKVSLAQSTSNTQRVWMIPSDWDGDPFNIAEIHLPSFDRTPISSDYEEVCGGESSGSVGDAASLKIQLDCVAAMERAFRYRHASHIRCAMHAAARLRGHGNGNGVYGAVQNYAQDLLKAGGDSGGSEMTGGGFA